MTTWLKGPISKVTDRDLIAHYTEVALEDWEHRKSATNHGGLGPSTDWAVKVSMYRDRLEYLAEELARRGLLDEET